MWDLGSLTKNWTHAVALEGKISTTGAWGQSRLLRFWSCNGFPRRPTCTSSQRPHPWDPHPWDPYSCLSRAQERPWRDRLGWCGQALCQGLSSPAPSCPQPARPSTEGDIPPPAHMRASRGAARGKWEDAGRGVHEHSHPPVSSTEPGYWAGRWTRTCSYWYKFNWLLCFITTYSNIAHCSQKSWFRVLCPIIWGYTWWLISSIREITWP